MLLRHTRQLAVAILAIGSFGSIPARVAHAWPGLPKIAASAFTDLAHAAPPTSSAAAPSLPVAAWTGLRKALTVSEASVDLSGMPGADAAAMVGPDAAYLTWLNRQVVASLRATGRYLVQPADASSLTGAAQPVNGDPAEPVARLDVRVVGYVISAGDVGSLLNKVDEHAQSLEQDARATAEAMGATPSPVSDEGNAVSNAIHHFIDRAPHLNLSTKTAAVALSLQLRDPDGLVLGEWQVEANRRAVMVQGMPLNDQNPIVAASNAAIDQLRDDVVTAMAEVPWQATVADVANDGPHGAVSALYLDAGKNDGLYVGELLNVLRPGRSIGRRHAPAMPVGQCRVVGVEFGTATAEPVSGKRFASGDLVRE